VHPIEAESYRRLRAAVNTAHLPPLSRAVAERVLHATADVDYARDLVLDEAALAAGAAALAAGAPLVVDVAMVAAGVTAYPAACRVGDPDAAALAGERGLTRTAAAVLLAARDAGPGAVYAVGCAPTALRALVDAAPDPALVIGLPVGFVDAAESKAELLASGLPAVANRGPKGGSAVAAAAVNALLYAGDAS